MKTFKYTGIALSLFLALPLASQAQTPAAAGSAQPASTGVVKKIDAAQGKITISHGPLLNLDMPGMTMLFRVADPKMLDTVKAGDSIKFVAEKVNGAFTITRLEPAGANPMPSAPAAQTPVNKTSAANPAKEPQAQPMSTGEIKKIDVTQGKITINHGPLKNLDMPAMTMVFRVADPKLLSAVKPGDNVNFVADKIDGAFTVTRLEPANAEASPAAAAPASVKMVTPPSADTAVPRTESASVAMPTPAARASKNTGNPANPDEAVPSTAYRSAFSSYKTADDSVEPPDNVWRAANDEMAQLGGHAGHTGGASGTASKAMPGDKPVKDVSTSPAMPAGHDMKNMKKGN